MAKKQKKVQSSRPAEKKEIFLGDQLGNDVLQKLKEKKKELQVVEAERQEKEALRKKQEAKEREKNKSFEELLSESTLSWKEFK